MQPRSLVATTVITGFLGVGKTTAIRSLLDRKPAAERWAVLINEFGEVGIDAALLTDAVGSEENHGGIILRELPGGCLCCAAGVPFQVALNQLLRKERPDRLIIEPTGLGHPGEILAILAGPGYRGVLDLRATVTLVDARKCSDERYREHAIFREQLQVADVVVANKSDLYGATELQQLQSFLAEIRGGDSTAAPVETAIQGQVAFAWLNRRSGYRHAGLSLSLTGAVSTAAEEHSVVTIPECGYLRLDNSNGEYHSSGWLFDPAIEFDHRCLFQVLSGLASVERMKAVFITDAGVSEFNLSDGVLTCRSLDECEDSRIEVIGRYPDQWRELEVELLRCRLIA